MGNFFRKNKYFASLDLKLWSNIGLFPNNSLNFDNFCGKLFNVSFSFVILFYDF